jgi:hypothetical protein
MPGSRREPRFQGVMGSRDIRPVRQPLHREDVVAARRDVVAAKHALPAFDVSGVEGYRVDGPDGRIGVVTNVTARRPDGPLDTIQVVTGLFIVRVTPVAESEILEINAERRRLLIRTTLRPPRSSNVSRMLRRFFASGGAG